MKKIFTEAEVEVKAFELEDVITVSTETETEAPTGGWTCSSELPDFE